MSTIRENILNNVLTTLQGVTTGNGFNNTLGRVERWNMHANALAGGLPAVFISVGSETKQPEPNPLMSCELDVVLYLFIVQAEGDSDPTDQVVNSLFGDIEKALAADFSRGGYAIDSLVTSADPFEGVEGQPFAGLIIHLMVRYQHRQDDPELAT